MTRKTKKSKTPFIVGGLFIFIMVGSAFGVILGSYSSNKDKVKYGEFSFSPIDNGMWRTKIGGSYMDFEYTPDVLLDLELDKQTTDLLRNAAEIDFTYDYDSEVASEIALIQFQMEQVYFKDRYFRTGATEENSYDKEIIKCTDATVSVPVIYFVYGNETGIRNERNCIIAESDSQRDMNAMRDRIVYAALGVME